MNEHANDKPSAALELEVEAAELVLTVSYDGAAYAGYARQTGPDGTDNVATVQGEIERALGLLFRREVATVCAGRTDAGVHALGQQVATPITEEERAELDLGKLLRSLGGLLPDDIGVSDVRLEPAGFSPRFDCVAREYRYFLVSGSIRPVLLRDHAWWVRHDLDLDAMRKAAGYLVGEHDFRSFCSAAGAEAVTTTMRYVEGIEVLRDSHLGEECLCVRVVGNAFLHNMVRIIVGTLVDVGRGQRSPEWVADVLAARDRTAAGQTAPAYGLTFWKATYPATEDERLARRDAAARGELFGVESHA